MQLEYMYIKNLGRLWLAYTELQGEFYMLQLMTDDSDHFTRPELSISISSTISSTM